MPLERREIWQSLALAAPCLRLALLSVLLDDWGEECVKACSRRLFFLSLSLPGASSLGSQTYTQLF